MAKKINYTCLGLLFCFFASGLYGNQDSSFIKYGISYGININYHDAEFRNLPGIPSCCPRFENGTGTGFNFGFLFEYYLGTDFWISNRLGINSYNAKLSKIEPTKIILNGMPTLGEFEHIVDSKFLNFDYEPTLTHYLIPKFGISLGLRIGYNLFAEFYQIEKIVKPSLTGTFVNEKGEDTKSRVRNEFDGAIQNTSLIQMGLVTGMGYELPLNRENTLRLTPELAFYFAMTKFVENADWRTNTISARLSVKYVPVEQKAKKQILEYQKIVDTIKVESDAISQTKINIGSENTKIIDEEFEQEIISRIITERTDTIFAPKIYKLDSQIELVGIDDFGNEIKNPKFKVEEFISNRLDPLLNYVFFDDNSSEIPSRYVKITQSEVPKFKIENLFRDSTLFIYQNILNILGKRLNQYKNAKITLIGCNADFNLESKNLELSKKRAESIKKYLVDNWSINENRIKIEARNLPIKASIPKDDNDKSQENRRVEIYSDENAILEPIFIEKIDRSVIPRIARFKPLVISEAGIKSWRFIAYQIKDGKHFKESGVDVLPKYVDWDLVSNQKLTPKFSDPILYNLLVEDNKGQLKEIKKFSDSIEVITINEKRFEVTEDYQIERFSIILFDFDKSTIEQSHKKIIDFIKMRVKSNSEIEILAYTDRTGDENYNKKLSEQRAVVAQKALGYENSKALGIGEDVLIYNNDLPEGRFYSRTVTITIKTKVK